MDEQRTSGCAMSIARASRNGRKSLRENSRSPSAMGVDTWLERSAISSGCADKRGSDRRAQLTDKLPGSSRRTLYEERL